MSVAQNGLASIFMLVVGALKTWLHVGSIPVLSLTTCAGKSVSLPLESNGIFAHWHCWGCYMVVAGLILAGRTVWLVWSARQAAAKLSD